MLPTGAEIWAWVSPAVKAAGVSAAKWVLRKFKKPDAVEILKRRVELRTEFERRLPQEDEYRVRGEAIIRDIKRMDSYPKVDTRRRGISPWFGVEVKGLYHRGLEVFIGARRRIKRDMYGDWKFTDQNDGETKLVYSVGRIPFDVIEYVDWDGDEYYRGPHIYCRFNKHNNQPYEAIPFFSKIPGTEDVEEVKGFRPWDKKEGFSFLNN
jgi:hypothetical protein